MGDGGESDKTRTMRFREWLDDNPRITLDDVAAHLNRSIKTVYMWRLGRPKEIPETALRLLEHETARVYQRKARVA